MCLCYRVAYYGTYGERFQENQVELSLGLTHPFFMQLLFEVETSNVIIGFVL